MSFSTSSSPSLRPKSDFSQDSPPFDPTDASSLPDELLYYLDERFQLDDTSVCAGSVNLSVGETLTPSASPSLHHEELSAMPGRQYLSKSDRNAFYTILKNPEIDPLKIHVMPSVATNPLHLTWTTSPSIPHLLPALQQSLPWDAFESIVGDQVEEVETLGGDPLIRLRSGGKIEHVVMHLFETETSYVSDLETLDFFRERLQAMEVPQVTLKRIFAGVDELRTVHVSFIRDLTKICQEWNQDSVWAVGQLFLDYKNHWTTYQIFIDNYQTSQREMRALEKNNPQYRQFMSDCLTSKETNRRDLVEFMVFPVQRTTRYSLILKDLVKYTPEGHRHREVLIQANKEMDKLANFVNEVKREEEERTAMFTAFEATLGCPPTLISAKRRLVTQVDCLDAKNKSIHVHLFTDLLMITKPLQKNYGFGWAAVVGYKPAPVDGDHLYKYVRWCDYRDLTLLQDTEKQVKVSLKYKRGDGTLTTFPDNDYPSQASETLVFNFVGPDAEKEKMKFTMAVENEKKRMLEGM